MTSLCTNFCEFMRALQVRNSLRSSVKTPSQGLLQYSQATTNPFHKGFLVVFHLCVQTINEASVMNGNTGTWSNDSKCKGKTQMHTGQKWSRAAAPWSIRLTGHITVLVFFRIWFPTRLFEGNDEVLANDDVTNLSWHLLSEERSLDYLGPAMAKRIRQTSKKFSQILMIHLNIYMFNYTRLILVCGILLTSMLSNNHAHPDLFLSIAESKFHQSYLLPRF